MTRTLASALMVAALCAFGACTDSSVGEAELASGSDVDGNGALDCADLELVRTCVNHPGSPHCAHADVNGDGVIDTADVHHVAQAILATGHHCDGHHGVDHADYHQGGQEAPHHEDTVVDHEHHPGEDPSDPHHP